MINHLSLLDIKNAILVVAHPDDEVLWFSSLLLKCKKIIVCYGERPNNKNMTKNRKSLIEQYPLDNIEFLFLPESNAFKKGKWNLGHKAESNYGITLQNKDLIYENNFTKLSNLLEKRLSSETTVITHNPWGEYGHEEHVQVHQVIRNIQRKKKFCLTFSSYYSDRTLAFMEAYRKKLIAKTELIPTDTEIIISLKKLYKKNRCWTWSNKYIFPAKECFYSLDSNIENNDNRQSVTSSIPLNYIPLFKTNPIVQYIKSIVLYIGRVLKIFD